MKNNLLNTKGFIIELDGETFEYSNKKLTILSDFKKIRNDRIFISDIHNSSTKVSLVDAPYAYAEILLRKKIQESGEFTDSIVILPHSKKKKTKNSSEIFYTAMSSEKYGRIKEQIEENKYNILFFPLYAFLFSIFKAKLTTSPSALIFFHDRFAEIIIAKKNKVYYSAKNVAFDTSHEHMSSLWSNVISDINSEAALKNIKISNIYTINWINSSFIPEETAALPCQITQMPSETIDFNGDEQSSSLFPLLEKIKIKDSESNFTEKLRWLASVYALRFNLITMMLILIAVAGYFFINFQTHELKEKITKLENSIEAIEKKIPVPQEPKKFLKTLEFVKNLNLYSITPSFKFIINDLSKSSFEGMKLNSLKMDYINNEIQIEAFGEIKTPFDLAQRRFKVFLNSLKNKNYKIIEKRFDTSITESVFMIKISRKIK